jgi:uncharacterized protein YaiL (DUF2058 family)
MSLSLRDQLLQAGLISEKQAKQAGKQQHQQRREQAKKPAGAPPKVDEQQLAAQRALNEKIARDQELNRQTLAKAEAKARRAQVKQLIEQNRLPKSNGDDFYNFIDGKKIRRIAVDAATRARLGKDELCIVRNDGRYDIVPAAIAGRIRERDPHAVIKRQAESSAAPDENDPYKDYVVPDDLMW